MQAKFKCQQLISEVNDMHQKSIYNISSNQILKVIAKFHDISLIHYIYIEFSSSTFSCFSQLYLVLISVFG